MSINKSIQLGLCCLNTTLRDQKPTIFSNRSMIVRTINEKGIEVLKEKITQNLKDLYTMILWNEENGIKVMRLSSIMFPHITNDKIPKYTIDFARDQLKKIGCSCDWNRTKFTLDDSMNESVVNIFIKLFNDNLIYRGYRMVNWDPEAKTTLSDEEVNFVEKNDNLYFVKYKIIDSDNHVTIATTRPETILGDSAICVNPKDKRYKEFIGRSAIVPIVNRHIPIIADEYVDIEYGTGCLKVTPAHDHNDKLLGEKHNLEFIDILNDDASLNDICLHYSGMDRFDAREKIIDELDSLGLFVKKIFLSKHRTNRTFFVDSPNSFPQHICDRKNF